MSQRVLVSQLADDLSWLEDHCQRQGEPAMQVAQLRLAAALVRNCVGPFLDGQLPPPLHLAVVGGAGAGKSTVANLLCGRVVSEANPQAGFTRHPIAFTQVNGSQGWTAHVGFLGPLRLLAEPSPSNIDADVFQVRNVPSEDGQLDLLKQFVVWDCPDMTTWAATGYVPRLVEVAALADVIVYVASDERYNDEVPTQFLELLLQAGKPVVACLVKMKEADAPALVEHFQKNVLDRLGGGTLACLPIPQMTPAQLADPVRQAGRHRIPLLNQLFVLADPPGTARRHAVRTATNFLVSTQEKLMQAARQDVLALDGWRSMVQSGQVEFDQRYRREFLAGEKFHRFDEALVRLLDMLELPGVGKLLSNTLWVVRTPYRLLKGLVQKALQRPESTAMPELPVLERAFEGWLEMLHKEVVHRAEQHAVWAHVEKGFQEDLRLRARERFQQGFRTFQLSMAEEVERTARAIYEELERNPAVLNALRGSKFALEVAAIGGTIAAGGLNVWDLVLAPLAASVTHMLVEFFGAQYVESQREQTRSRQQALVKQHLSGPLAEWLVNWPTSGGSRFERLQLALRRLPQEIRDLDAAVTMALGRPVAG